MKNVIQKLFKYSIYLIYEWNKFKYLVFKKSFVFDVFYCNRIMKSDWENCFKDWYNWCILVTKELYKKKLKKQSKSQKEGIVFLEYVMRLCILER